MLIAIEGIDGSGKATQADLLRNRIESHGGLAQKFSFPEYGTNPFSIAIERYLNGEFGDINHMPPYLIAALFAGDRFAARSDIMRSIHTGRTIVCDRYVPSNLAHQGAKLDAQHWDDFFAWVEAVEFEVYAMPRPDLTIFLDMPVAVASANIAKRKSRNYTALQADFHEKDESYLERCRYVYQYLISRQTLGPWATVACVDSSESLLAAAAIHERIWALVQP